MTAITQQPVNNPGIWSTIVDSAKSFSASAGETLGKVWAAVSEFFSSVGQTLGQWLSVASDALVAAKNRFCELPRETQIVAGATLGVSLLGGVLLGRCCGSKAAPAQPPANAAQQPANNANGANANQQT